MPIYYKSGYKYQLVKDYTIFVGITPKGLIDTEYLTLTTKGYLTIKRGYAWDGASGPTLDTSDSMRGSLVHDALYQLMRMGLLDHKWRKTADRLLRDICLEDGMIRERAEYWYDGVRGFADGAALPCNDKRVIEAPVPIDYTEALKLMKPKKENWKMLTKDNVTSAAGFIAAVSGTLALSLKDTYPEIAFWCGTVAAVCVAVIGFYTGKPGNTPA
jgi:hypothetical protein